MFIDAGIVAFALCRSKRRYDMMVRQSRLVVLAPLLAAALLAAFFFTGSSNREAAIAKCEQEDARKQQCFEELILREAEERGIDDAFDVLAELYARDREFALYCHGNTHELGAIAHVLFDEGHDFELSEKTSYCGFGFYHGFLEAMFASGGIIADAARFCEYVDRKLSENVSGTWFACYHGIGHGVADGTDPSLWGDAQAFITPALKLCDSLVGLEEYRERCASGVFNALAISYKEPKYKLESDPNDPYAICRKQEKRYAREACYDQMNTFALETSATFSDALAKAARVEEAYRAVAVMSLAAYQAQSALGTLDPDELLAECVRLEDELAKTCAFGFAVGLVEFGKPGAEYEIPLAVCSRGDDALSGSCFEGLARSVRDRMPIGRHAEFCARVSSIDVSEGESCRAIMDEELSRS